MKVKSEDNIAGQRSARDPFSAAKDELLLTIGGHPCADENALKVSIWMVKEHANRREFEATGKVAAWPSIRLLATETGLTKSRVQRGIERLELMGVLRVERPEKRGAKHHNIYSLSAVWLRGRYEIERDLKTMKEETRVKNGSKNVRANVDIHFGGNVRNDADIENSLNVRTGDAEMSAQADHNLLENHLEGDGAPLGAPQSPIQEMRPHDQNLTMERCGTVADDRDQPPLPSDGPQEGDEPILTPIDRDLPEIPEDVVERFRQADEHAPPPEVRYPVDVEEMLDEVASLIDGDAIEFFNLWEDAFICGDEKSATFVSGILGRAAKKTTRAFVDYPEAVGKFLVDPLSNCLANLAERRGNDPSAVDAAISDFLAAVLVLPQVQAQSLGVNHG